MQTQKTTGSTLRVLVLVKDCFQWKGEHISPSKAPSAISSPVSEPSTSSGHQLPSTGSSTRNRFSHYVLDKTGSSERLAIRQTWILVPWLGSLPTTSKTNGNPGPISLWLSPLFVGLHHFWREHPPSLIGSGLLFFRGRHYLTS